MDRTRGSRNATSSAEPAMVDPHRLISPGMDDRVIGVLRSGVDPRTYFVGSARLREVIKAAKANRSIKRRLLAYLEKNLIRGQAHVSAYKLGMAIWTFTASVDDESILAISADIKDLNKLPYTHANGERVQ